MNEAPMPRVAGVLETCLPVENVEQAAHFYERLFGFKRVASNDRFCAFEVSAASVLLLFQLGGTLTPVETPGGVIPPHGGNGPLHFAFAIHEQDFAAWQQRLAEGGVTIESCVRWDLGGRSLYFRDLDNHLVELATPGTWPSY